MSDRPKSLSDIDSFWDLHELLPQKRPVSPSVRMPNTDTVELTVENGDAENKGVPVPPRNSVPNAVGGKDGTVAVGREHRPKPLDPYLIYTPSSRLISRVEVSKWESHFRFYENFREDAKRLWNRKGAPCLPASYFSYIPQYSQLKYSQLKWYLWWRMNVYDGVYLDCDFCYILLFIYEIINCPDLLPPEKGLGLLCDIWLNYRDEHRRIDSYMCDWLCDYCLIHKLPCPIERLEPILAAIVENASFKEFYMDSNGYNNIGASILFYSSIYDWHKSRYVTKENAALFSTHIHAAFDSAYKVLIEGGEEYAKELRIERTAYEGALCSHDMKRTIAVEYISYTRSPKLRFVVTDMIKYSENRIRMALGIRSRLKVEYLPSGLRACIDKYFEEHLPAPKKVRTSAANESWQAAKEYEKLYEPVSTELSLENALKIEESSWAATEILTAAFEEDETPAEKLKAPSYEPAAIPCENISVPARVSDEASDDEFAVLISALGEPERRALVMLSRGDVDGVSKCAKAMGMFADALADRINEAAFDIIGDSIIEPVDDGFDFISDYKGDILKWLK